MKIAHTTIYAPHQSGLYETTREIVAAERKAGHDSRLVDWMADVFLVDRGVPYAPRHWMNGADVVIDHNGIGDIQNISAPIVVMLHGTPEYCFVQAQYHDCDLWSAPTMAAAAPRVSALVTLSERYLPAWSLVAPHGKLSAVSPPVDLDYWSPNGAGFDYGSPTTNIAITDRWRPTKHSFELLVGVLLYAESHPGTLLHLYAEPDPVTGALAGILGSLRAKGVLGTVMGAVDATALRAAYRCADLVLTSDCGTARTIREAMACGCPVLADTNDTTPSCNMHDPAAIAAGIEALLGHDGPAARRATARTEAERLFDPSNTARGLERIYKRILRG